MRVLLISFSVFPTSAGAAHTYREIDIGIRRTDYPFSLDAR